MIGAPGWGTKKPFLRFRDCPRHVNAYTLQRIPLIVCKARDQRRNSSKSGGSKRRLPRDGGNIRMKTKHTTMAEVKADEILMFDPVPAVRRDAIRVAYGYVVYNIDV